MSKTIRTFVAIAVTLAAGYHAGAAPVINEIMFRPGTSYPENTGLEFIELYNPDAAAVDLSGWAFIDGIDYTFPSGTTIAASGYLVIAANPSVLASSGGFSGALGPWTGKLSNDGETITLAQPDGDDWSVVDTIDYADEGDWATRTRDSLGGWSWVSAAASGGKSLERRNPALVVDNGQNWGASTATGGSPGAANSQLSSNIAPVITGVKHFPAVPTSSDAVTISCQLTDESAASALTATLYWRNATSTSTGSFTSVAMTGDGAGYFSADLRALANKQIVEFYVSATDGTNTRTWPAPSSEGQNTNCTYQVDNEVYTGTAPVYRLVLTAAENAAYESLAAQSGGGPGGGNANGDRRFNLTLVATRGTDTTIRYLSSMRIRGNSSRGYTIKPLRINLPTDHKWDGVSSFLIGPRGAPWQFLAHKLMRAAGLVAADASPLEVRRQGVEYSVTSSSTADYGQLARIEDIDGDYVDNHWPDAASGQVYRKTGISSWAYTSSTAPSNPDSTWSGWTKESARAANDWSDVMNFTSVWQAACAPHFNGETSGNVASGTWDGTGFTDAEIATLSNVADLDYLVRFLAVMTVLPNFEENIGTGEDDDYAAAFINDGSHTRMFLVPHDLDTVLGTGEKSYAYNAVPLFDSTESGSTGMGGGAIMKPLQPFLGTSTITGTATYHQKYLTAIRELFGSIFDADTSSTSNPAFYQFVDNHLSEWVPASNRASIKTFMTNRQNYLLGLVGAAKIPPTAGTSSATRNASSTPTVRLNEVLTNNTSTLLNGTTYPDVIELYNSGASAAELSGKQLTDYDGDTIFTFPNGTTIAAGGYLTVFADSDTSAPGLHTGFALDSEGDAVFFYDTAASGGALLDTIEFGFQFPDESISRLSGNTGTWGLTAPTLGATNGAALALGNVDNVVINEWAGAIKVRTDKDYIELYNPASTPVALGGVRVTDDLLNRPSRYDFRKLSYIAAGGHLVLDTDKLEYGLDGDFDQIFLVGENGAVIDRCDFVSQPEDHSTGRTTDGATGWSDFAVPTPGLANNTALPAAYTALLNGLRITEIMYKPAAPSSASNYEFIELQNVGTTTLDLSGVRFTNGIDYTFASGTSLAPNAYVVVCKDRTAFLSRYPSAESVLAAGVYSGALDNSGETIALTLPMPWDVHILKFRYEPDWYPSTAGDGYSLVTVDPATTAARNWDERETWAASADVNGNPGGIVETVPVISSAGTATGTVGETFSYQIAASSTPTSFGAANLPSGLHVNTTTGAITGAPVQGGTFVVTISATNASGTGAAELTLTISKATAAVAIGDTTATYDGTEKSVTVTTSPDGLTFAVTYDSSTVAPSAAGTYDVVATIIDAYYEGTASDTLTITPTVTSGQGGSVSGTAGGSTTLSVTSAGGTATYQWQRLVNGVWTNIPGATSAAYALLSAQRFDAGSYRAVVTVDGASATSETYTITVNAAAISSARLGNLSTRGLCLTGSDVLIPGFVIGGTGTKRLLIRAVGPTLGEDPFSLAGVLPDPRMTLKKLNSTTNQYEDVANNDNWGDNANADDIRQTTSDLFAFAIPDNSLDAALLLDLAPGAYTVVADDAASDTGIAIVELYDTEDAGGTARLVNISNRGFVGTGDNIMIPGTVITSEGSKTLLVRAVGPTLAHDPYNVPGTMVDPKLVIYSGSTPILANDNWGENPDAAYTATIAADVFAFPLDDNSKDAAFVVTLPPGAYTIQASSVDGGTGVALVEIYEVK